MSRHVLTTVAVGVLSLSVLGPPVQAQDNPSAQELADLSALAEAGATEAQYSIGVKYDTGEGVPIARTSDDQIVSNVTACKLALTTRALDYLTANDGADFLRAARALSLHFPPIQRVADVSERIEDLSDIPDADIERMKAIRDAARAKNSGPLPDFA